MDDLHSALKRNLLAHARDLDRFTRGLRDHLRARDDGRRDAPRAARRLIEEGVDRLYPDDRVERENAIPLLGPAHPDRSTIGKPEGARQFAVLRFVICRQRSADHDVHDPSQIDDLLSIVRPHRADRQLIEDAGDGRAALILRLHAEAHHSRIPRHLKRALFGIAESREQQGGGSSCISAEFAPAHFEAVFGKNQEACLLDAERSRLSHEEITLAGIPFRGFGFRQQADRRRVAARSRDDVERRLGIHSRVLGVESS